MKEQLRLVFELSEIDRKIREFERELEKIPLARKEREDLVESKGRVLAEMKSSLEGFEKEKRDKEGDVELTESRLREFQGKLSQIKTNKEYQAALKEIAETKKGNKGIEDQVLEIMTRIESLGREIPELEKGYQEMAQALEREREEWVREEKKLRSFLGEASAERKKLLDQMDRKVLDQYNRIRRAREDAVTFVEGGACLGCNMNIPPQLRIEVQKLKAIHACPSCHRILYLQEWRKEEEEAL